MDDRPGCLLHPKHKVWFDGTYGIPGHKRQRYKCVAPDGSTHVFTEPLPRQRPADGHCLECEHTFLKQEGPQSARHYSFTAREIASALIDVSRGASYRQASFNVRRRADRFPTTPAGWTKRISRPQLVQDWVEVFAPIVFEPYRMRRWPQTLLIDHLPFHVKQRHHGRPKTSGKLAFVVFGALGYQGGNPYLWSLRSYPNPSAAAWQDVFSSMSGRPHAIVSDEAKAQFTAVRNQWPGQSGVEAPFHFLCQFHLHEQALKILERAGMAGERRQIRRALDRAFHDPWGWMRFVQAARRIRLSELDRWLAKTEPIMAQQVVIKRYPVTTGALENKLRVVKARLNERRWQFGNRERIDRLLMLIQLELNGHAVEEKWAQLIREALATNGGVAPPRREIMDKRGHSLHAKATPSSRATRRHRRKIASQRKKAQRRSALGPAT